MKISDNTIGILRNFSDINANILFNPGKKPPKFTKMLELFSSNPNGWPTAEVFIKEELWDDPPALSITWALLT